MTRALLSLGSNVGDRSGAIASMVRLLSEAPGLKVLKVSGVRETRAVGNVDQPDFLNAAAEIETGMGPHELLKVCKDIEGRLGRRDRGRWGPREADIDIVLFGLQVVDEPDLKIPHPEMHRRRFVLEPLEEIAPEVVHPVLCRSVRQLLADLKDAYNNS
jgi:2-amino-4-hydroxy-6-hydroxymethyldihydropteridine diphosphokinase